MSAPSRSDLVQGGVSAPRRAAAEQAQVLFVDFCDRLGIPPNTDALLLHLTQLQADGVSGHGIRERLSRLNLAAKIEGNPPWGHHPDVQLLLRGLHRASPIGGTERALPLYRELVEGLVDTIMAPTAEQLRRRAVLLFAAQAPASARSLALLQWGDVTVTRNWVEIRWPRARRRRRGRTSRLSRAQAPQSYNAIAALKATTLDRTKAVFGVTGTKADYKKVRDLCRVLPTWDQRGRTRPPLQDAAFEEALTAAGHPGTQQLRDQALILIAFGAALTGTEAIQLRASDIRATPRGLVVTLPGRRQHQVGIPGTGDAYCPVAAWQHWQDCVTVAGLQATEETRAFLSLGPGGRVRNAAMDHQSLLYVVHQRCYQAGLGDQYVFTSLRAGWIRSALREGWPLQEVASHAGFQSLDSLSLHERRENLLRHNVVSRLGL